MSEFSESKEGGTAETQQPTSKSWYSVEVPSSHIGTGRKETHKLFVYAKDVIDALGRTRKMRGWKRNLKGENRFPNIRQLTPQEVNELTERIKAENVKLGLAKKRGFYGKGEK